ncbi:hypothetical protein MUK42_02642 [Musa troglodytarum]|uniref:DUF3741 domain-containing protein n=1 Tax=Musa troglodytarum TaxID=320322 RepID=A0A9E7EUB7_9LILI|nr:hypothetical protein MUK42_02642 [Musa troglodytarum]URD81978.1 hypothetical protein MUK42_02642 [Musa troglodytarum]
MAKRSYRRSRPRNDAGCMWGLISLFDFRRGHPTQKLLSDKRHESNRHTGTGYSRIKFDSLRSSSNKHEHGSLVGEIRDDQVDSVMRSVKTLMEEEMSQHIQKKITSDNLQIEGHPKKSYKQRNKKLKSSDAQGINLAASSSLDGHQSDKIKRRLRHIIGESRKARHVISMDGVLHRIPVRSNYTGASSKLINSESTVASLASSSSRDTKKLSETLSLDKRNDKKIDLEECQVNINSNISSSRSQFSIYEEARKHLAEMLGTGADSLPTTHASESLGRVLSLPRYNELCPASSRQRVQELIMSSEETGNPSLHQLEQEGATNILSLARENLEFSSFPVSMPSDDLKFHILNTELVDTSILELPCIGEDLNNKEILEAADAEGIVRSNHLDVPLESSRSEIIVATEICEESAATQGQVGLETTTC